MNYLYNGVPFPVLPDVDENTYRYVTIFEGPLSSVYPNGESGTLLWFTDNSIYLSDSDPYLNGGAVIQEYLLNGDAWEYRQEHNWPAAFAYPYNSIVYTNYDLYKGKDGTLYLAATTPIPCTPFPTDFDPRSFAYGMRVGAVIRSLRGKAKEKEYTHYSYNGTVLPKLPEEIAEYPYAFMYCVTQNGVAIGYYLNMSKSKGYVTKAGTVLNKHDALVASETGELVSYLYNTDGTGGDVWHTRSEVEKEAGDTYLNLSIYPITWANYDVCRDDDTLYFAGSDPVPVEVS